MSRAATVITLLLPWVALACEKAPPEPEPFRPPPASTSPQAPASSASSVAAPASADGARATVRPVAKVRVSPDDPKQGVFSLADATEGLTGEGTLVATLSTDHGDLSCELFEDRAPLTVANFVGLARGKRPFKDATGQWVTRPGYDGLVFHRIIKGFMIQGGDPKGDGSGEPGYVIPDEVWVGATHDRRGQLCMANRGPNTNGMQFFITDAAAPHLDSGYTIFGQCTGDKTMDALVATEVSGDRAVKPPKIKKVTIRRAATKAPPPSRRQAL